MTNFSFDSFSNFSFAWASKSCEKDLEPRPADSSLACCVSHGLALGSKACPKRKGSKVKKMKKSKKK